MFFLSYSKEVHQEAHNILSRRRDTNRQTTLKRQQDLVQQYPEVNQILRKISGTSANLIRIIAAGGNIEEALPRLEKENLQSQQALLEFLVAHGYSKDYLDTIYSCKNCQDSGFVQSTTCDCLKTILKQLTFNRLGVPRHLENCSFDNFSPDKYSNDKQAGQNQSPKEYMNQLKQQCQRYADEFSLRSSNLLLSGSPGLGKTHISIAIAKRVIEHGYDVLYIPFYQLCTQLESAKFGRTEDPYSQLISTVNQVDLLILDDVGAEFAGQFPISVLYDIVNTRMIGNKPTIMNTNLPFTSISERYTDRVASRMLGGYRRIQFKGSDLRLSSR